MIGYIPKSQRIATGMASAGDAGDIREMDELPDDDLMAPPPPPPKRRGKRTLGKYVGISSQDLREGRLSLRRGRAARAGRRRVTFGRTTGKVPGKTFGDSGDGKIKSGGIGRGDVIPFQTDKGTLLARSERLGKDMDSLDEKLVKQKVRYRGFSALISKRELAFNYRPSQGLWKGQKVVIHVDVPKDFPFVPPICQAVTPIFHPNFDKENRPKLAMLQEWIPAFTLNDLFMALLFIFLEPVLVFPDLIGNKDALEILTADPEQFEKLALAVSQIKKKKKRAEPPEVQVEDDVQPITGTMTPPPPPPKRRRGKASSRPAVQPKSEDEISKEAPPPLPPKRRSSRKRKWIAKLVED